MQYPASIHSGRTSAGITVLIVAGALFAFQPVPADASSVEELENTFTQLAETASPAVVNIEVEKVVEQRIGMGGFQYNNPFDLFSDEFLERFFGRQAPRGEERQNQPRREFRQQGQGSGFLITADGYILTNHHVVGEADKVTVTLSNGNEYDAEIVGSDAESDVGVIKIEGSGFPHLPLGDSTRLKVGQWVVAIGNPFGLSHSITSGIVSAKGRSGLGITDYEDFIQTDAAINPGNSGGPLLNLKGEVVGINTAIFSRSGGYMGIGLAIPVNNAKIIYEQLKETGSVTRGFLGIVIQPVTQELAEAFGIDENKGVLIAEIQKGSPAEKAGFKQGDVIVEFNGKPVEEPAAFSYRVSLLAPGTEAEAVVVRDGERLAISVELGKKPAGGIMGQDEPAGPKESEEEKIGLAVQELTDDIAQRLGYEDESGVVVSDVEPGSPAARAGIREGALIQQVDRKIVSSVKEFADAVKESIGDGSVLFLVKMQDFAQYLVVQVDES